MVILQIGAHGQAKAGILPYLRDAFTKMRNQAQAGLTGMETVNALGELLCNMLTEDDSERYSCEDALKHRFFTGMSMRNGSGYASVFICLVGILHMCNDE